MDTYKTWYASHLASIPRSFWYCLLFTGASFGIYVVWLFTQNIFQLNSILGNVAVISASLAGFVISWIGVKRSYWKHQAGSASLSLERRLHFWLPFVFSIALLAQAIGNSLFLIYRFLDNSNPPLWGEFLIMGMYPALLAGILLLPRDVLSGKIPLLFLMEGLILMVTLVTFSWYFIVGPALLQSQGQPLPRRLIDIAFPVVDLLVLSCLMLLSHSTVELGMRRAIHALSLALIVFVFTDSILAYQTLQGLPSIWLSVGWIAGNFIIALSLQAMRWQSDSQIRQQISTPHASTLIALPIWRSLLSYALIPFVAWLGFNLWRTDSRGLLATGTYYCILLLLVLIFVKQIMVIQEIHGLNLGFQQLHRTIDEKNTALEHANARLETLATTDPLTELLNHRALVTVLDQELARSQQYQRSCSLLFFDIDHFKALNDGYGHAGGDVALREFGSLLRTMLPLINTVGRWGGEEFLAILPEQDALEAATVAEELRSAVASHSFMIGGGMHLTCSIGVASSPAHALQSEALLQATDSAMYGAKRLGRNQVRLIDDPAVSALLATNTAVEGREELSLIGTVHALALLVEKRDMETGEHAQRVGELLLHLALSVGLSEEEAQLLSLAGRLHDIGKIVVPDTILQKREPLTDQEIERVHQHPQVGAEVISSIPSLRSLAPIVRAHHEWWNGTGYPDKLAGDAIPLGARLLSIADAYTVMTTKHFYRDAHESQWAFDELRRCAGTQFDPALVEPFLLMVATMPASNEESVVYHHSTH